MAEMRGICERENGNGCGSTVYQRKLQATQQGNGTYTILSCSNWGPMYFYGMTKIRASQSISAHKLSKTACDIIFVQLKRLRKTTWVLFMEYVLCINNIQISPERTLRLNV